MNTNIANDESIANGIEKLRQTDTNSVSLIKQIEELERVYGRSSETQTNEMYTNTANDELTADTIKKLRQLIDNASVSLINKIEEMEQVYGRSYSDKFFEPSVDQLKISNEILRLFLLFYKQGNNGIGNIESTSNGNPNHSVNIVSSTHLKEQAEKTMADHSSRDTSQIDNLTETRVFDEEYSATHLPNRSINEHDPKSANVVAIPAIGLQEGLEPVAGPSGLQQVGIDQSQDTQEMQMDDENDIRSSVVSSKRGSSFCDDREYEDSSNDELRSKHLAKKSSEPQKKRKKRLAKNFNTDQNGLNVVSPVEAAADPNVTWTNIHSSIHLGNNVHNEQCRFCSTKQKNLAKHLSEKHPDAENYMSRPSPSLAGRMRRETTNLNRRVIGNWIGICGFCEKRLTSEHGWYRHLLLHTGEKLYTCDGCNADFDTKKEHQTCKNGRIKTIYEMYSNGAIKGFICDLCNFIQINEDRLKVHLRNEHKATSIGQKYQQIGLILDESQPGEMIETNWHFVEEHRRFKCGLDYCEFQANDIEALQVHLTSKHRKCVKTMCVHCNDLILLKENESMVEMYVNHLNLHGNDVYECSLCENAYNDMKNIVEHLIDSHHSNALAAKHYHRVAENMAIKTITKEISIKFQCIICDFHLDHFDSIINHFVVFHFGCNIDTRVLILEKIQNQSEQQLTFDSNRWRLRQTIACDSCKTEPQSMKQLVDHCRNIHNSQNMGLKLTQLKLINVPDCPSDQREVMFDRIFYACHHCIHGIRPHEFFADVDSVYEHWLNMHANNRIPKPFRFQVSEMAACHYCDIIGPYHSLKHHHAAKHDQLSFCISTIANKNKCALCQFVENSDFKLSAHFLKEHGEYHRLNVFSPLCLAEPILNKLLELNIQKTSIYEQHNSAIYPGENVNCVRAINATNYCNVVCSFCEDFRGRTSAESIDHLLNYHKYDYKCVQCPGVRSNDMIALVKHDIMHHARLMEDAFKYRQKSIRETILKANFKSFTIFQNGLIVATNCLVGTRLDLTTQLTTKFDLKMKDIRESFEKSEGTRKTND